MIGPVPEWIVTALDALLTPEEDTILNQFLQEMADRGFPASNKRVVEAALAIVQKRDPEIRNLD